MKKVLALFCLFVLCSAFQCDDELLEGQFLTNEMACNEAVIDAGNALFAFENATSNNYNQLCNAYKDAIEAQILVCGDEDGTLQSLVDNLGNCSLTDSSECQLAMTEKNTARENYLNAAPDEFRSSCEILREAIGLVIEKCGSTPALLAEIEALGDCPSINGNFIKFISQDVVYLFNDLQFNIQNDLVTVTGGSTDGIFNLNIQYIMDVTGVDTILVFDLDTTNFNYQKDTDTNEPLYTDNITINDTISFIGNFEGSFTNPVSQNSIVVDGGEINIIY